jgi:chemotaxis signal transduction protein
MIDHERRLWTSRAARMRQEFDAGFVVPPLPDRPPRQRLLEVSVGGIRAAIPLQDCSGVQHAAATTPLPARERGFIGLTAVGGAVLPLYDLAARLGLERPSSAADGWIVVSAGRDRVCFLVDGIDGYAEADLPASAEAPTVVTIEDQAVRVIALAPLIDALDGHFKTAPVSGKE